MKLAPFWLALLCACGSSAPTTKTTPASPPEAVTPEATPAPAANPLPDTNAGRQLAWALTSLLAGKVTDPAEITAHFAPEFLAKLPAAQVIQMVGSMADQLAPLTYLRAEKNEPDLLVAIVRGAHGDSFRIYVKTDPAEPHLVKSMNVTPASDLDHPVPAYTSWDDVTKGLHALAPHMSYLAAELGPNGCTKIAGADEDQPRALGSAFKLYILATLAKEIHDGKRTWNDPVTVEDALKSLPGPDFSAEAAGKVFPLRDVAERMIKISDNTATDHLLAKVGKESVEAMVKASGHAHPELDVPFMSTRELFALKLLLTPAEQQAYLKSSVAEKRKALAALAKRDLTPGFPKAEAWKTPILIEQLEWFASPNDLCKLATKLDAAGPEVRAILSINPIIPDPGHEWSYIGAKGGSEPGVFEITWLLERARDGKKLFLAIALNNPDAEIDEGQTIATIRAARTFLASP